MRKEYDFSHGKRGAVAKSTGKTRITIYLDDDIIEAYRKKGDGLGQGYQTLINEALRETLRKSNTAIDAKTLRKILREELKKIG
ncbi:MAG: BrnA antitoxin family protein [gamma proteobacterium symbiont of Ctena orbiculata]|nr:BrnA antitoxin family protein [Candidatus Thiodiazotropha taylori]MBT3064937.1 BrnA antitoxin family protein [Candidatus Thiodiazotropha sp. (ex Lucina pensylvanica)]MBV2094893.1 BrnA antitoxin family protein [Candidatus Thiodiazotropha sp. (ex Codakia orbicularis)]PUB78617.1 MAG: CopG family transcriptional regulator [gamma proteobacterium symbiont of Ctena orbiculata]